MVRKGSTVRVRQRALEKPLETAAFLVLRGADAASVRPRGPHLGHIRSKDLSAPAAPGTTGAAAESLLEALHLAASRLGQPPDTARRVRIEQAVLGQRVASPARRIAPPKFSRGHGLVIRVGELIRHPLADK